MSLLVDKSLVQVDDSAEQARYRLLETIRYYAAERLDQAGEVTDDSNPSPGPLLGRRGRGRSPT